MIFDMSDYIIIRHIKYHKNVIFSIKHCIKVSNSHIVFTAMITSLFSFHFHSSYMIYFIYH